MTETLLRLLIVDDDPVDRETYRRLLKQHSDYTYDFLEADLGEDGLTLCQEESPDCILLDYRLPDLDGLEFLSALANPDGGLSYAVIMLTGSGSEMLVAEAMKAGAADYMPKGVLTTESLGRAVSNAVEKHRLRTAVREQRQMLVQTNQELQRQNEEIQQFYHMLSHELKTPLTAAREFVSIVLDGLAGPLSDTQHEYLTLVKQSCDQITLGLNDLLDVTRLDTGKLSITPHPMAIDTVVDRAVASTAKPARDKGIRLQRVIVPNLQEVCMDEHRIVQVLTNLLGNAVKWPGPWPTRPAAPSWRPASRRSRASSRSTRPPSSPS